MQTRSIDIVAPDVAAMAELQREAEAEAALFRGTIITSDDHYELADSLLSEVVRKKDATIAMRQSAVGPIKKGIAQVEAWFRPVVKALEASEDHLKQAMSEYREAKARAEAEARELAARAAEAGDSDGLHAALAVAQAEAAAPAGNASCSFRWVVKRVAEDMLPDEWWTPDMAKIQDYAQAHGGGEDPPVIPGVVFERKARIGARR
jgi:hypothetical protein